MNFYENCSSTYAVSYTHLVEIFTIDDKFSIKGNGIEILALIPTIIIGVKKKDVLLTVLVGIISVALLRLIS